VGQVVVVVGPVLLDVLLGLGDIDKVTGGELRNHTMKRRTKILLACSCFTLYFYVRLNVLNAKPLRASEFSVFELAEIYTIGLFVIVLGYPISPEASQEHFMLLRHHQRGDVVKFTSASLEKSYVVQQARQRACRKRSVELLDWPMKSYTLRPSRQLLTEARVALALNTGTVNCTTGTPKILVDVDYPPKLMATFLSIGCVPVLRLEEGLMNILEERGWYSPYVAMYE
jgi:hypothetical protein